MLKKVSITLLFFGLIFIAQPVWSSPKVNRTPEIQIALNELFLDLLYSARYDRAYQLLDKGLDVNYKNKFGKSFLHAAVDARDFSLVNKLIQLGADVNSVDSFGNTPLMRNMKRNRLRMLKFLLEKGSNIHHRNHQGQNALMLAMDIFNGEEAVIALVKQGANIHQLNKKNENLLFEAISRSNLSMVKFLLQQGVNPEQKNIEGKTPMDLAIEMNQMSILKQLLNAIDKILYNHHLMRALYHSVVHHKGRIIDTLIYDAKLFKHQKTEHEIIDKLIEEGMSLAEVLNFAVYYYQQKKPVDYLLNKGALIHGSDREGNTPLMFAQGYELFKYLEAKGADINAHNHQGHSPLTIAAQKGNKGQVDYLLQKGVELRDNQHALLYFALVSNELDLVKRLLKTVVDLDTPIHQGKTALMVAVKFGHEKLARYLISQGANLEAQVHNGYTPLLLVARDGDLESVKLLLKLGANINARDKYGLTSLSHSIFYTRVKLVQFLIEQGADINIQGHRGQTPLIHTIQAGNQYNSAQNDIAPYLIKLKVKLDMTDQFGFTPLHWSVLLNKKGLRNLLIKAGANLDSQDRGGNTPAQWLNFFGNTNDVLVLANYGSHSAQKILASGKQPKQVMSQKELDLALGKAVYEGSLEKVKQLLDLGANIESKHQSKSRKKIDGIYKIYNSKETPLLIAAMEGHRELFHYLRKRGANLVALNASQANAFYLAVVMGHVSLAKELYQLKDFQSISEREWAGLFRGASTLGTPEALFYLQSLRKKRLSADPKAIDYLKSAVGSQKMQNIKYLISQGIPLEHQEISILESAIYTKKLEIVKYIFEHMSPAQRKKYLPEATKLAIERSEPILKFLVQQGGDLNQKYNGNPLYALAFKFYVPHSVGKFVLTQINWQTMSNKRDLVNWALASKSMTLFKQVLASVPPTQELLTKLLETAIDIRHIETVNFLLTRGANIKNLNLSEILYSLKSFDLDLLKVLVKAEIDIHQTHFDKITPLMSAVKFSSSEIAHYLLANGARATDRDKAESGLVFYFALNPNFTPERARLLRALIKAGASLENGDDSYKDSPLAVAAQRGDVKLTQTLLNAGANINGRFAGNRTLIHFWSLQDKELKMIKFLRSKGLDLNAVNSEGLGLLHTYFMVNNTLDKNFLSYVLKEKNLGIFPALDINIRSKKGETALDIALKQESSQDIIQLLRQYGAKTGREL